MIRRGIIIAAFLALGGGVLYGQRPNSSDLRPSPALAVSSGSGLAGAVSPATAADTGTTAEPSADGDTGSTPPDTHDGTHTGPFQNTVISESGREGQYDVLLKTGDGFIYRIIYEKKLTPEETGHIRRYVAAFRRWEYTTIDRLQFVVRADRLEVVLVPKSTVYRGKKLHGHLPSGFYFSASLPPWPSSLREFGYKMNVVVKYRLLKVTGRLESERAVVLNLAKVAGGSEPDQEKDPSPSAPPVSKTGSDETPSAKRHSRTSIPETMRTLKETEKKLLDITKKKEQLAGSSPRMRESARRSRLADLIREELRLKKQKEELEQVMRSYHKDTAIELVRQEKIASPLHYVSMTGLYTLPPRLVVAAEKAAAPPAVSRLGGELSYELHTLLQSPLYIGVFGFFHTAMADVLLQSGGGGLRGGVDLWLNNAEAFWRPGLALQCGGGGRYAISPDRREVRPFFSAGAGLGMTVGRHFYIGVLGEYLHLFTDDPSYTFRTGVKLSWVFF